jgi:hypothetical protein
VSHTSGRKAIGALSAKDPLNSAFPACGETRVLGLTAPPPCGLRRFWRGETGLLTTSRDLRWIHMCGQLYSP